MVVVIIPKHLVQQQPFLITVEEADEEDWSEHSEVLIADLSLHRLRQWSCYVNSESSGEHFQLKKAPFVLSCSTVKDRSPEISINLVPWWGHFTPFFSMQRDGNVALVESWMDASAAAIWLLHSSWHLLSSASFGLQLEHHSGTSLPRLSLLYVLQTEVPTERLMWVYLKAVIFMSCHYIIPADLLAMIYHMSAQQRLCLPICIFRIYNLRFEYYYFFCSVKWEIAELTHWPTVWSEWG